MKTIYYLCTESDESHNPDGLKIVKQNENPFKTKWNGFEFRTLLPNDTLIQRANKPPAQPVNRVSAWPSMMDAGPNFQGMVGRF